MLLFKVRIEFVYLDFSIGFRFFWVIIGCFGIKFSKFEIYFDFLGFIDLYFCCVV